MNNCPQNLPMATRLLCEEAEKRHINVIFLRDDFVEMRWKGKTQYMKDQFFTADKNSYTSNFICKNKDLTKNFLNKNAISTAEGWTFHSTEKEIAINKVKTIGWPVVIKPLDSCMGDSVFANIYDVNSFENAWNKITKKFKEILVEKKFEGKEFRILATREKVLGVINRIPANITGDGNSTIKTLIDKKNDNLSDEGSKKIIIDDIVLKKLSDQHFDLNSIPAKKQTVFLRDNSNRSTGGDTVDFTDVAHPSVKDIAIKAVKSIPGLIYGGVDFMTEDITKPQTKDSYIIIEINASPGIFMHHYPSQGKSRDVAKEIIDLVFPETKE